MKKARRHRDTVSDSELEPQGINEKQQSRSNICLRIQILTIFYIRKKNEHSTKLA